MPAGEHSDGHGHDHTAGANAKMLSWALALTTAYLVAELVGAWVFRSLALLSDAAHMFTDVVALAIALAAIKVGQRPADDRRTFGYRRFEILAAAFNAVLLFVVAAYILYEGVLRIMEPQPVGSTGMLVVAGVGLAVNLISMRLLSAGKERSLNVKGAYLEVWADMLGSLGVIGGAAVIMFTDWTWVDPIVAIAIGLWVLPRTWTLLKNTTHILLEGVPAGLSLAAVRSTIAGVAGVADVHDLHLWAVSSDEANCSVHVALAPAADHEAVRKAVATVLAAEFAIRHATIQTEREACADAEGLHP
ncbi:cation diffusion facilitator family transporter [Caulobacter sp. 17J65-9]|uniref:cation diffusion facilitator family transporter n=1 Tax=Caulobacter sp. 17J65-9 TaxID=2709382 RepID=UPI0013C5B289|nr:cation diffusion facilitator family transporter [Caulobacter sp. 17J65-9]NEX91266.1 cation transporter [Caulobacter sp. 17J65-9]